MAVPNPFDPHPQRETTDRTIKRLQARIADGDEHLRAELAEALMRSAQESAVKEKFEPALRRIDEGIKIIRQLVQEGQLELDLFVGRALLFRATILRYHKGSEAGITALNDAIRHLVETASASDPQVQNDLATALINKADLLIDPLGAYSAALAAQEQAVKIWQHLLNHGNLEFRQPLIGALMACSDSKIQNGDAENAINDLRLASEIAQEGIEADDPFCQPLFVQTQIKLTRLYDHENDLDRAFETIQSAIRTIHNLISSGIEQAKMMFTTLYMQSGMLYEKIHNSQAALAEFDRCRDVYVDLFRDQKWGVTELFVFRTGLANTLMCRGNMLADLKRFPEAEQAFEESVWQYQQAAEHRPPNDHDDTLIPYSIGVVQLNHANLLVAQDKWTEAIELKKQALDALQKRMEAGHSEILPNFLTAYRKLIDIRRAQNDTEQVFALMDNMITILEKSVDEGKLEYRIDLALSYRQRSIQQDDVREFGFAQKDAIRALQLFRTIADDDRDIPDVHISKIQWSEMLYQIAVLHVKQNQCNAAFNFLQKEIVDAAHFYEEGNDFAAVDLLLAYSQYIEFIETFGNHLDSLKYPSKKFNIRLKEVREHCRSGIELSQKKMKETGSNLIALLFFMMKTAFFYKADGILLRLQKNDQEASQAFEHSIEHWNRLLEGLENLKAKDRYDAAEKGDPIPDWDIPGGADDPYQDRYVFYVNELRETMQLCAKVFLDCDRQEEAAGLFEKENALTRELAQNGVKNADRFLIVSLTSHARSFLQKYPTEKTKQLYEEAIQILQKRFACGDVASEDFWVLRRVCKDYLEFLQEKREESLRGASDDFVGKMLETLSEVQTFPPPLLWRDLWEILEVPNETRLSFAQIQDILKRMRKAYKRHPEYKASKELKKYDRTLKAKLDGVKAALLEEAELAKTMSHES